MTEPTIAGYELTYNHPRRNQHEYLKQHANNRVTNVRINGRLGDYTITATGINDETELGHTHIGATESEQEAITIAHEWMQTNPDGVTG